MSFHDSLCGPDPAYFATLVGGAKKHGEVNYTLDAPIHYDIVDKSNPIMKDMSDVTLLDEAFFTMTWAKDPGIHVLANTVVPPTRSAGEHKGRSGAADLDIRTHGVRRAARTRLRLDARPHLCQLCELPDTANAAPGYRLGREEAG